MMLYVTKPSQARLKQMFKIINCSETDVPIFTGIAESDYNSLFVVHGFSVSYPLLTSSCLNWINSWRSYVSIDFRFINSTSRCVYVQEARRCIH